MEKGPNKKFVFICTDSDCKKNGSKKLVKALSNEIKASGLKKSVEVMKCKCMGHCKNGPNVVVENQLYHKVSELSIRSLEATG